MEEFLEMLEVDDFLVLELLYKPGLQQAVIGFNLAAGGGIARPRWYAVHSQQRQAGAE
ncbi:MAG: hypothetical protein HY717_03940, partial [Planctomycetes bacterium]|nr:hypothetical protein [Planctomycetota bacterium]